MKSAILVWAALAALTVFEPVAAQTLANTSAPQSSVQLRTYPTQVYFTTANAKEGLSATIFMLIVEEPAGHTSTPQFLALTYKSGGSTIRTERLLPAMLEAVDVLNFPPSRLHSPDAAARVHWPHAYRLMLSSPAKGNVDSIEARLTLQSDGAVRTVATSLSVRRYEQKTSLIFPFRGNGIISVGGVLAGGHRNRSGLYAIDALGLTGNYGPMLGESADLPGDYAGWGREVIAPAAGKVVIARNDRPDQPKAGNADPAYFLPQYPDGGDPGNLVVIDHGNGEFSMIAHLQKGSVRVKPGDTVRQGQVVGLMGNSGDTSGPHVHYQLQSGPDWERSDALPSNFTNVQTLAPGSYFEAR